MNKPSKDHAWGYRKNAGPKVIPIPCPECDGINLPYLKKSGRIHVYCGDCDYTGPGAKDIRSAYEAHNK